MLRTLTCGEPRAENAGQRVTLAGWVDSIRDHGGVTFIDLRDRYGRTQVTLHPEQLTAGAELLARLRDEQTVRATGTVQLRPAGMQNQKIPTGEVELIAEQLEMLSDCPPLPFDLAETSGDVAEELRFRYRYLDMRRPRVLDRFLFRSRMLQHLRRTLFDEGFVELETPVLTRSTPEGARDFLVPSRLSPGEFYALPQSPQIFKQIFMVAGFDRYMQIVKCFRDEDLRADRQQEFTQLDLEMSYVEEDDVLALVERLMKSLLRELFDIEILESFPVLTYEEAMRRFGCDAPDLRYGLELVDVGDIAGDMEFRVFRGALAEGGTVRGIRVPGGGSYSRKEITELETALRDYGAGGLAWVKIGAGELTGPLARFLEGDLAQRFIERFGGEPGDLVLMVADARPQVVSSSLAELRRRVARREGLVRPDVFRFAWVTEFPLFEWDEEEGRFSPCHHPFTAPHLEDANLLETEPARVRARAYDLVLNGVELGGGSIRIHDRDLQQRAFRAIGMGPQEAEEKFQFLLEALRYGAPPHGGIALGIDRLAMLLLGLSSIREVIPFPKTQRGTCPLTGAPTAVTDDQLRELGLALRPSEKGR